MADRYSNFAALELHERAGVDFRILARRGVPAFAVVAPHGGSIEPGTSELAVGVAEERLSVYTFDGIKPRNNTDLHITSTNFDEPLCLTVIRASDVVVTLHGEGSEDVECAFLGGRDTVLGERVRLALEQDGFVVAVHPEPDLQGLDPCNLCNRGRSGAGVQLELSRALRLSLFEDLTPRGREHPTERFGTFVRALQAALSSEPSRQG